MYKRQDLSVQAFLTDEGYDPLYGARPLRRAIMKYLEDTLAEQCLSKTLYPNTIIHVSRKKVEGTLMTYTNELEVEVDFSDVDPNLLDKSKNEDHQITSSSTTNLSNSDEEIDSIDNESKLNESQPKSTVSGKAARFFRKK